MGDFTFLDHLFNVCRSLSDVLHICVYLLLILVALIVALYRFDIKLYVRYVYIPVLKTFFKKEYDRLRSMPTHGRYNTPRYAASRWTTSSNRLPYFVKSIKSFFNNFKK